MTIFIQDKLNADSPKSGDMWHERFIVILVVIGTVGDLILVSKAYIEDNERYLGTTPDYFTFYTKDEFLNDISYCDCSSGKDKWLKFVTNSFLPKNLLDHKTIAEKYKAKLDEIKYLNCIEYVHVMKPMQGDCWYFPKENNVSLECLIVVETYLKNFVILYRGNQDSEIEFSKHSTFLILPILDFKRMIFIDPNDIDKGYRSNDFKPEQYVEEIELFKKNN